MKNILLSVSSLIFFVMSTTGQNCHKVEQWIAKVDPSVRCENTTDLEMDLSDQEAIVVFERLVKNKGKKGKSAVANASLSPLNSQRFETPSIEIASLFYASYLFYGNADFANAIALQHGNDTINSNKAVTAAFGSYKKWLNEIKRIGLTEARRRNLDPLANSKVSWY